ncbi:MAG: CHAT domain-containing protein, partial [Deltaproteobacteria bacterium]|nr:CHAT domain-containing protein [Deltaproteobacteria bacterium]
LAVTISNLAQFYQNLADFSKARELNERALAIRKKALGPDHPDVAQSLNNLALVLEANAEYGLAETYFRQAVDIWERVFGPDHPETAHGLNNLAELYKSLGDCARAQPLYERVLNIRLKVWGPDHPEVALALNNLAGLYDTLHDYPKAEELYQRAKATWEKTLGAEHPNVAIAINNLALVHFALDRHDLAEMDDRQALAIREKAFGLQHPDVAASLNNLAGHRLAAGDYEEAEMLYLKALAIMIKSQGPEYPLLSRVYNNLAVLYAAQDNYPKALESFYKAQALDRKLIDQVMGFTGEEQKLKFLVAKRLELYAFVGLAAGPLRNDTAVRQAALDLWLHRKGLILEAQRRFQEALFYGQNPEALRIFRELGQVRSRMSKMTFSGPGREELDSYLARLAELKARVEELESQLSRLSQVYAQSGRASKADTRSVAAALPTGSVLLEFIRVDMLNYRAKSNKDRWQPAHYLAWVLPSGGQDRLSLIDLGPAEAIDLAISDFKQKITDMSDLSGQAAIESSGRLYSLVIAPLRPALGAATEIFISPDWNLNLVPFEILMGPNGRFLIDDYTFNYLTSGRDLTRLVPGSVAPPPAAQNQVILVGDPSFDLAPAARKAALTRMGIRSSEREPDDMAVTGSTTENQTGMTFSPLPGTREEIQAIQNILGAKNTRTFLGADAQEEALIQGATPRIVHFATHGFFLSDLPYPAPADQSALTTTAEAALKSGCQPINLANPLLRSGLALAGANQTAAGDSGKSDGLLTAQKILGWPLRDTELVVLSACETGLGQTQVGEGVYGLRRAFLQAGVKGLVFSLWSVADRETKELMTEFYRNYSSGRFTKAQALRQAALKEKNIAVKRYGRPNPLFWGAFIFLGAP